MGHNNLAVLTGDRFNSEGFYTSNFMAVLQGGKKSGRNNEVTVLPTYQKAGIQRNAFFFLQ